MVNGKGKIERTHKEETSSVRWLMIIIFFSLGLGLFLGGGYYMGQITTQNGELNFIPPLSVIGAIKKDEEQKPEEDLDIGYLEINRLPSGIVNQKGNIIGYVFLDLTLETRNLDEQLFISERLHVLKNAFGEDNLKYGITVPNMLGPINYEGASERLKGIANKLLGKEIIYRVFITKALGAPD